MSNPNDIQSFDRKRVESDKRIYALVLFGPLALFHYWPLDKEENSLEYAH